MTLALASAMRAHPPAFRKLVLGSPLLSDMISSHRMVTVNVARDPRFLWAVISGLAIVGASREGQARTVVVSAQLDYAAAPGCPAVGDFEAIVYGRLGYSAFRTDAPDRVIVRIASAGRALEGRLEWRDATGAAVGEQLFPSRSGDCAELTRAMGFALALQIQLMAATIGENRSGPAPAPPADTAVAKIPTAPPAITPVQIQKAGSGAADTTELRAGPSVLVGLGAAVGLGVTSDPVAIGRVFAALAWSHAAVELGAEVSVPSTTHRTDGAGFSQEQILASLVGCGVRGSWSVCAVGKAGQLRVVGQAVDVPLTASALTIQAGLRLSASHILGKRTYIVAHVDGLGRLTQGTVTLDSMPVWTTPTFAGLLGIDVALRFR
jgi:hypothetical protein